jgi:hypothetical protein
MIGGFHAFNSCRHHPAPPLGHRRGQGGRFDAACGDGRLRGLIVAAAYDSSEAAAADSRFTEIFLASAFPNQDRDALIPPCTVVITQFDRLERHHQEAGMN